MSTANLPNRRFWLSLGSMALAGCLPIPHTHVTLDQVSFQVTTLTGQPVPRAEVHRYAGSVVGAGVAFQDSAATDSTGRVHLRTRHQLHAFLVLIPDGEAPYRTVWCIDAPGFLPVAGAFQHDAAPTAHVALRPDTIGVFCPVHPKTLYDVTRAPS